MKDSLNKLINSRNNISTTSLAKLFDVKVDVIEKAMNLPDGSLATNEHAYIIVIQEHLKNMILVVELASTFCENYSEAFEWYSCAILPSFGGRTAAELVSSGNVNAIIKYLKRIDNGGYA